MKRQVGAKEEIAAIVAENLSQWEESDELYTEFAGRIVSLILAHKRVREAFGEFGVVG